jgi:hypothetical protein
MQVHDFQAQIIVIYNESGFEYSRDFKTIDYELTSRHDYEYDSTSQSRIFSKTN